MNPQYEKELLAQTKNFFVDSGGSVVNFFSSYQFKEIIFTIKTVLIIISFIFLLLIIALLVKIIIISPIQKALFEFFYGVSKPFKSRPMVFNKKKIEKKLKSIDNRLKSGLEANYKSAVLEAEKLFDRVLKEIGYGAEKKLENIAEIKEAGKIKKQIIEDKKFKLSKEQAESAVEEYKRGLGGLLG